MNGQKRVKECEPADEIGNLPEELHPEAVLPEDFEFPHTTSLPAGTEVPMPEVEAPPVGVQPTPPETPIADTLPGIEPVPAHESGNIQEALPDTAPSPVMEPMPAPMIEFPPELPMDMGDIGDFWYLLPPVINDHCGY